MEKINEKNYNLAEENKVVLVISLTLIKDIKGNQKI